MKSTERVAEPESNSSRARTFDGARVVALAVKVSAALATIAVVSPWLPVFTPRWLIRGASVTFLWALLVVYVATFLAVVVGGTLAVVAAVRAWKRHDRAGLTRFLRPLVLASSCLIGLLAMEVGSEARLRWSKRLPRLPTEFEPPANAPGTEPGGLARPQGLSIVVVGESSALGEPYHPWLSVGQLVGWQLERVFPGRRIDVDIRAEGGLVLEQAVLRLLDLKRRPDAMIVFAGHNEFQTRFGWSRNVAYYADEGPKSPLVLLEFAHAMSSTCALILDSLDRYYGQTPPPPEITRELVDHPICSVREHAFLREDFRMRLDAVTAYCTGIGCLPILIVPGSNDGSFEPDRSVLAPATSASARAAFAAEFFAARAGESTDPQASASAYRRLLSGHPGFAESHYRLARLLARIGSWEEAREHFVLARDLDGFPLRCPSDFREVYHSVARARSALLIDGPEVLSRVSAHGVLDDELFHDAHHPGLLGVVALANEVLAQLKQRDALGWPESVPFVPIEPEACAHHFSLDLARWAQVCERSKDFYARTAFVRFDPAERSRKANSYGQTATDLAAGRVPGASVLAGLAIPPFIAHTEESGSSLSVSPPVPRSVQ
jgi:hypothetical protein